MQHRTNIRLALFALCLLPGLSNTTLAADGPVTIDDIRQMRKERLTVKQMMEKIEERGLGFEIDAAAERKLRGMAFSPKQVGQLKGMDVKQPEAGAAPMQKDGKAPGRPAGPAGNADGRPAGVKRDLTPAIESEYAATAERVKKIVAESNTTVKLHATPHINLLANPKIAALAMPDLEQVQKLVAQRFPEPLASGVDARAANIALLESRYEYDRWIRALYKVHEEAGLKFEGADALRQMLGTNSVFVHGVFSVCLEGMDTEAIRRRLAFSVGYQYVEQFAGSKGADALRTGFGNLTEVMMFREPTMTVLSGYSERKLGGAPARWADIVRQQFMGNKVESVASALAYSTRTMQLEEYAISWSLVEFLSTEPRNYAELVVALEKGTDAATAIENIYGLKDAELLKRWKQFVLGKR